MNIEKTCVKIPIIHNRIKYEPIKFGNEKNISRNNRNICIDCGIDKGGYHHPGCPSEECPICGKLLRNCNCIDE